MLALYESVADAMSGSVEDQVGALPEEASLEECGEKLAFFEECKERLLCTTASQVCCSIPTPCTLLLGRQN